MKSIKFNPQKNTAQAMVEFAIALPILLLLLYGLLEAGRLLFMYSTVVTASRQAARYGATSGGGTGGAPRYQDCQGIRDSANRVDYLNAFTDANIQIEYDEGLDNSGNPIAVTGFDGVCDGATDGGVNPSANNTTRIVVTITGHFTPLVRLVPFGDRPIEATSARTILRSITIAAPSAGADTTKLELVLNPHRVTPPSDPVLGPHSNVGELVVATATVTNTTGTTVPTGSVTFIVRDISTSTEVARCDNVGLNSSGIAACNITFNNPGTYNVHAEYTPTSASLFSPSSDDEQQVVGQATPTVTIEDDPDPSVVNNAVSIRVIVDGAPGLIPTGTVNITSAAGNCTAVPLIAGVATCPVTYTSVGTTNISAVYSGDSRYISEDDSTSHEVLATAPTAGPPTVGPTSAPPTAGPTALPTPVSNCNTIRDMIPNNPIKTPSNTMTLDIPNPNGYPVTMGSIYVAWNYSGGHSASNSNLKLMSVSLGTTTIWQSTTGLHQPYYTISSFSNPPIIPANQTTKLTFTFDQTYDKESGEAIQIQFSTPGCESYPVLVPKGASTPVPPPNLKVQVISGGTDNNQQTQFRYQVQNIGSSAASNIAVRIYFTLDGSNAASSYVLEKYWDQSGVATVSGPTLASGSIYYFTISYGSTSLAAGSLWEFQTSLHLSSWASTFSSTNDWWHTTGALPSSYTDWPTIPAYANTSVVWGSPP
ncbi:MAG TPA: Ig-like domain repeat protein [Anaerolineales bacterium]|nr:Ig-like domain repeat protein [Anaerolineales bacterium]